MNRERIPIQPADLNSDGKDGILEQYLADTMDLRNESALIIVHSDGRGPVFQTLDGTQVFSLGELSDMTNRHVEELTRLLDTGRVRGVRIGDMWFARKEEVENYHE
jgi:hypothetical protein